MAKRAQQGQAELATSPDRIEELHVLGLEIKDLEQRRMELTRQEKAKRAQAAAELHARKLTEYQVDGVSIWLETGTEKVKVKLDGGEDED
jgi:hypothetical protein